MKRWQVVVLAGSLALAMVAVLMGIRKGRPEREPAGIPPPPPDSPRDDLMARPTGAGSYVPYRPGPPPTLPLMFEYPENWKVGAEARPAGPYQQVIILGPRNALDTYSAGLVVRELRTRQDGGSYADAGELVERRRRQYQAAAEFALLTDRPLSLGGAPGHELEFEYTTRLPHPHSVPRLTTVKTRVVVMEHAGKLYELSYSADRQDYERHQPVFAHLLDTVRFLP